MITGGMRGVAALLSAAGLVAFMITTSAPGAETRGNELPLGRRGLPESRSVTHLARGVTRTEVMRGFRSPADHFTVEALFAPTKRGAKQASGDLRSKGYHPRTEVVQERAPDDPGSGPLGYVVRVGRFQRRTRADALTAELAARGYPSARTIYTGQDGDKTTGPFYVNVLDIDLDRFQGEIGPELATEIVPGREKLTGISRRERSIAGINGGYFVIESSDGTPGDLAGTSVVDGELVSEAVNGRTSLLIGRRDHPDVATVSTALRVAAGPAERLIDGKNRTPGLIRSCGGVGGDVPTQRPKHDFTCTDDGELILFTPDFGGATEPGKGVEAVLNSSRRVVAVRARGGPIPRDGEILAGTADGGQWLRRHARPGTKLRIRQRLAIDGRRRPVGKRLEVVNGGPRLLSAGRSNITAHEEGFVWSDDPSFYYYFGIRRNPRTLAGVTNDDHLLLVTIDGNQPGWSLGASFEEEAAVMKHLGALEGVNLDGGGSTTLTIGPELANRPSDTTGERPIGDALLLLP